MKSIYIFMFFYNTLLDMSQYDNNIGNKDNLSKKKIPAHILDRQVHKLKPKKIVVLVKVLQTNQFVEESKWQDKKDE